ncbi:lysine-2,3-aminomutase-like protein [Dictyobacter arantiisoli]|uniref:Lysine 2,3-aminomutase n=1 Tax=Dictyobacter arantiisoli TaxID=2014874 RepID=A0A5A5TH56_9CHLR|nr:lysine-2,3-aminomutase-like protein [Dictyobacter arantiisoli]GCF10359.1 lysine 2,3-aminomutase [Dictyobacter arantiisoli]
MKTWNKELQDALQSGTELAEHGLIAADQITKVDTIRQQFATKIPLIYMQAIKRNDESDPVWRTVVPTEDELHITDEERLDPIGDISYTPVRGITHRYPDRVLFKPTHTCAVYCRFCFRRYAVGHPEETLSREDIAKAMEYIEQNKQIWEVIFTGGDPLTLADSRLEELLDRLRAIEHVKIIRFHTRVPVVLPSRITENLALILRGRGKPRKPVYVVTHINHAQEITPLVEDACDTLVDHGVPLLNQCVLLKDTNDSPEVLEALLRKLVEIRIKPYYLHHGDLARGTGHFRTTIEAGQKIMKALRGRVSGICQPTYVLDIPGGYGKVPINAPYLTRNEHEWIVEDIYGDTHSYPLTTSNAATTHI